MRTRNLKPAFFKNDILCSLDPLCRLLFSGLWCMADRLGRLEDRPLRIKAELLPFDDCDVDAMLNALSENGFILRYCVENKKYIQVTAFLKHQHPHMNETESEIPAPEEAEKPHNGAAFNKSTTMARSAPSLNLIPYTLNLNPQTDVSERNEKAEMILSHFEKVTGKSFRDRKTRLAPIKRTLAKGFDCDELMGVIDRMKSEWHGTKYEKLITPSILFGDKFEEYLFRAPTAQKSPPLRFNNYSERNDYPDELIESLYGK